MENENVIVSDITDYEETVDIVQLNKDKANQMVLALDTELYATMEKSQRIEKLRAVVKHRLL